MQDPRSAVLLAVTLVLALAALGIAVVSEKRKAAVPTAVPVRGGAVAPQDSTSPVTAPSGHALRDGLPAVAEDRRQIAPRPAAREPIAAIPSGRPMLESSGNAGRASPPDRTSAQSDEMACNAGEYIVADGRTKVQGLTPADFGAGDSEVHAVGVYEALLPDDRKRGFGCHPRGRVTVGVKIVGKPIMLVLTAYAPVHWVVQADDGVQLAKVIAGGYHTQSVSGVPQGVPVVMSSYYSKGPWTAYSYGGTPRQLMDFAGQVENATGKRPTTFQGRYRGAAFIVDGKASLPL